MPHKYLNNIKNIFSNPSEIKQFLNRNPNKISLHEIENFYVNKNQILQLNKKTSKTEYKELNYKFFQNTVTKELLRLKKSLRLPGHPKPYYISLLLNEEDSYEITSKAGSLCIENDLLTKKGFIDVKVGNPRDDDFIQDSISNYRCSLIEIIPTFSNEKAIREAIWIGCEDAYRRSLSNYHEKKSTAGGFGVEFESGIGFWTNNLSKNEQFESVQKAVFDKKNAKDILKQISLFASNLKGVISSHADLKYFSNIRTLVNSEGFKSSEEDTKVLIEVSLKFLIKKKVITKSAVFSFKNLEDLPNVNSMCYELLILSAIAKQESVAPKLDSYVGPVLLSADAAGTFIHEVIGHRVESGRLLSMDESGSALMQSKAKNKKITNKDLVLFDDPNIRIFNGIRLFGNYSFDEEGVKPEKTIVLNKGIVTNFLTTRVSIKSKGHKSSGHARSDGEGRPTARMGNTFFLPNSEKNGHNWIKLKGLLRNEITKQKLPYGIIILICDNGETSVSSEDIQAFRGTVDLMIKIYPNGKEELVQSQDFSGTPLSSLSSIIAFGDKSSTTNHFCVSDSGVVGVSTTSVAVLMNKLELQQKSNSFDPPYIESHPFSSKS